MKTVALCVDQESALHPELIGLADEDLQAQSWLEVFSLPEEARREIAQSDSIQAVWVASCPELEPINLAAAIKMDNPAKKICLVADKRNGSLQSRAAHAGLDGLLDAAELVKRYSQWKETALSQEKAVESSPAHDGLLGCANFAKTAAMPAVPAPAGPEAVAPTKGFLLPVVSGCGGSGKSTIAALFSLIAQKGGLNVVLVDLDLQFGDCRELLGYEEAVRVDELIAMPRKMSQLRSAPGRVALVAPPERMEQAERLSSAIPSLLDALRSSFDLVIVNTGSFWSEGQVILLERCSKALFLLDQRPSSLRGCRRALDLCTRCGIAASPFVFGINRCSKGALYSSIDISCAFHGAQAYEFRDGGRDVEDLMAASQPEDILASKNPLAESAAKVLGALVPAAAEAGIGKDDSEGRPNWLSTLRRK